MKKAVLNLLLAVFLLASTLTVQAVLYTPSLNEAQWRLELSPFECRMWQPIPIYGDAVFSNRAGESQQFYLRPKRQEMKRGQASLISTAPVWDGDRTRVNLGYVPVTTASQSVKLGKQKAFRLLHELYEGMSPVFTRTSWYTADEKIKVGLSSVNFRKAYSQYQDCLVSLLPVNYEQIKRSRVHFKTAQSILTPKSKTLLDNMVLYVNADTAVTGFYIDGHTDSVGRRLYNLDLSKKRAEAVTRYLSSKGIDEAMITTRYHGERYPVTNNKSTKNRASNRRVTVRLERDGL
jgi:sodium-type flagellar protein MotY